MLPAEHFVLCLLSCIAFAGVSHAVYEDCQTPPPVDHARAELFESEHINTAIYSCAVGYLMKGPNELICNVDTEEWVGEPPSCSKVNTHRNSQLKKKVLAIPEDPNVDSELAQKLDVSCIQAKLQAPEISHGTVSKYERRRNGNKIFLVAFYACDEDYAFERTQENVLYCGSKQWLGELPTCLPRVEYPTEDYDDEDNDDDDEDDYDQLNLSGERNLSETAEPAEPAAPPPPPPPVENESDGLKEVGSEVEDLEPQVEVEVEPEVQPELATNQETKEAEIESVTEPAPIAQLEPEPEPEPELHAAEVEPEIVVRVDEPQPKPETEPELELQPEPTEREVEGPATDINIVVAPTKDSYTPRLLDENCGEDRGGCAHKCQRLLFPGENEPRLMCTCHEGYTLDPKDYTSCHDIDECQESNGGCSQICNNLPGGFDCACEKGYEIDAATGKTCVDIDECAQPELAAECADGCENTPGSYRCVNALNTKETQEEAVQEPEQPEEEEPAVAVPSCNPGFVLAPDGSACQDINECDIVVEDGSDADHVPHRVCQQQCENTLGSYRCSCREGFHLLEDQSSCAPDGCQQLDNPQLNRTRCAHECQDLSDGGYVCVCPEGYRLGEDLHSCEVLETVCSRDQGHERCRPGSCRPSEDNSTFSCLCPPGYTSEVFSCQDVDECALGTHKCSHDCFNTAGGYQCLCPRHMSLQEPNGHVCVAPDPCAVNNNGCEQLCLSAEGGACTCTKGYQLGGDGKSCQDVDECQVNNGGCQQLCRNQPGAYECACAPGYEALLLTPGDSVYCLDIDECATRTHRCGPSMRCENLDGSYTCLCAPGYALGLSSSPSSPSSPSSLTSALATPACLDIDECSLSNANCSHFCLNLPGGFQCECPAGFQLAPDGFSCVDIDECALNFGNCSSVCINLLGGHACACDRGYELGGDGTSCQDVDECAGLLSGGCTHECINKPGSYECGCPLGYLLQEDERSCRPALVGCPPGTRHTDQGCEPIECGLGLLLGADGSCVDIDECRVNNGGCSNLCQNTEGSYKCACPAGHQLAANKRDCADIDECAVDNGGCEGSCHNELGGFKCQCPAGQRLSFDERSCYELPKTAPAPPVMPVRPLPTLRPLKPVTPATPLQPETPLGPVTPLRPETSLRPVTPPRPEISLRPQTPLRPVTPLRPSSVPQLPAQPDIQVRDQCVRFQAPDNGQAHCNKYRHKRMFFYNTRCKVRCNPGYQLIGSEIRSCGASGNWEGQPNKCVPIAQPRLWMAGTEQSVSSQAACPALPAPRNGVISPAGCTQRASSFGTVCRLQCNMGFVPVAGLMTSCLNGWSLGSVLECKPFGHSNSIFDLQSPWQKQHFRQQTNYQPVPRQQPIQPIRPIQSVQSVPYIRCPENVVILLNAHQSTALVTLQRPVTNLDYHHVVAFPAWAKHLQGHLPAGTHKIVFRAHDPVSSQSVGCQTIITVKQAARPSSLSTFPALRLPQFQSARLPNFGIASQPFAKLTDARRVELPAEAEVSPTARTLENTRIDLGSSSSSGYCPPSFEVRLKENQSLRSVVWEEPRFEGKLLKIYKSSFPGALFGLGDHDINYEATTTDGVKLHCRFQIHVKAPESLPAPTPPEISYPELSPAPAALTQATHESYVVCPGKEPVQVTASQSVNLPVGCTLKNVRPQTSTQTHPKRVLLTSLWRQYNNF